MQSTIQRQVEGLMREKSLCLERLSAEIAVLQCKNEAITREVDQLRRERQDITLMAATMESVRFENNELKRERRESAQVHEVLINENKQLLKELQRVRQDISNTEDKEELVNKNKQLMLELQSVRLDVTNMEAREASTAAAAAAAKAAAVEAAAEATRKLLQEASCKSQPEPESESTPRAARVPCDSFDMCPVEPPESSESRLRSFLSNPASKTEDLEQAILSVEALVGEARRELSSRQLRDRRAAFEQLHVALEASDEDKLEAAINEARRTRVDEEDIQRAQTKLDELRSRTDDERRAKALRDQRAKLKDEAYVLVKRDDAKGLQDVLGRLDQDADWSAWRDHAGRSLLAFAAEMNSEAARAVLQRRTTALASPAAERTPGAEASGPAERTAGAGDVAVDQPQEDSSELWPTLDVSDSFVAPGGLDAPVTPCRRMPTSSVAASPVPPTPVTPATPSMGEEGALKQAAFRAVVKDDVSALTPVLEALPSEVWSAWQNRAGKNLLDLSQERGSSNAYSALAKALGLVTELPREEFEERETVWVYIPGDAQPRRATVMEDTPKEADTVLVEYWDGDEPALHLDRCMLRKMAT